ncbi:MAG: hypothetical protein ACLUDU_05830 [Butyricimonas faecihominis]
MKLLWRVTCRRTVRQRNAMQTELLGTMLNVEHSVLSEFNNPEFILEWKDRWKPSKFVFTSTEIYRYGALSGSIMGCVTFVENGGNVLHRNYLPIEMDNTWIMPVVTT